VPAGMLGAAAPCGAAAMLGTAAPRGRVMARTTALWRGVQQGIRKFGVTPQPIQVSMAALRARQPKDLLRSDVYATTPPEDLTPSTLVKLSEERAITDPARILQVYRRHMAGSGDADVSVLIRAFVQLGFLFDPNSFFATADRQFLTAHKHFKWLAHDLAAARQQIPSAAAPVLLYAMACLEYRSAPLLAALMESVEAHLHLWRVEVLSLVLHSMASLGLGSAHEEESICVDLEEGASMDFSQLFRLLVHELEQRAAGGAFGGDHPEASLQDWSRAAFALAMAGLWDAPSSGGGYLLPILVANACAEVNGRPELDGSGWAQFFLYQTLYCADVEKPASEEEIKRAMPMWIQERLHHRWLDSIVLHAQPQGADQMQRDVDASLRRTNTQALLNCSVGRDWDEQHCWFAGHLLEPKVALECDSMLPLGPGRPRPSGWLAMKSRVMKKMGYTVVTMHKCFWDKLTEDQKDEQILRLRASVGYKHNQELERSLQRTRQSAHTYKGREKKEKDWKREPAPPSE